MAATLKEVIAFNVAEKELIDAALTVKKTLLSNFKGLNEKKAVGETMTVCRALLERPMAKIAKTRAFIDNEKTSPNSDAALRKIYKLIRESLDDQTALIGSALKMLEGKFLTQEEQEDLKSNLLQTAASAKVVTDKLNIIMPSLG